MSTITVIQLLIASILAYFMIFSIIHRICTCVEKVATVKACGKIGIVNGRESVSSPGTSDTTNA